MRPAASSPEARRRMQAVRRRGTAVDLRLRSALHRVGFDAGLTAAQFLGEAAGGPPISDRARRGIRRWLLLACTPHLCDVAKG